MRVIDFIKETRKRKKRPGLNVIPLRPDAPPPKAPQPSYVTQEQMYEVCKNISAALDELHECAVESARHDKMVKDALILIYKAISTVEKKT